MIVFLNQDKVEINLVDKNGKTPLMLATGRKHDRVVSYLKKEMKRRNSFIPRIDAWLVEFSRFCSVYIVKLMQLGLCENYWVKLFTRYWRRLQLSCWWCLQPHDQELVEHTVSSKEAYLVMTDPVELRHEGVHIRRIYSFLSQSIPSVHDCFTEEKSYIPLTSFLANFIVLPCVLLLLDLIKYS